jgi:hypothetical protein
MFIIIIMYVVRVYMFTNHFNEYDEIQYILENWRIDYGCVFVTFTNAYKIYVVNLI